MRHKRTDPACDQFAGVGRVWMPFRRVRVRSLRRFLFDRGRGRSCPVCMPRGRWQETRAELLRAGPDAFGLIGD